MYWKTGSIFPLFKDGEEQTMVNYRLIAMLNCISNVLETLIFDKLYEVLYNVIAPKQYGLTKLKSTMTHMIL